MGEAEASDKPTGFWRVKANAAQVQAAKLLVAREKRGLAETSPAVRAIAHAVPVRSTR